MAGLPKALGALAVSLGVPIVRRVSPSVFAVFSVVCWFCRVGGVACGLGFAGGFFGGGEGAGDRYELGYELEYAGSDGGGDEGCGGEVVAGESQLVGY